MPLVNKREVLTIGYEGKTVERYMKELREAGVTVLCDVRRNPLSRKRGFSKRALAAACVEEGIRYEHLPELGIASAERKAVKTVAERERLFARYERETLARETGALAKIRGWVETEGERVALTCFERAACECHRHCVAEVLAEEGRGEVVDL